MTRSLLLTVALALCCLGAATAAYMAGRSNGPDLSIVARAGTSSGARSGMLKGQSVGRRAGYRAGYAAGYQRTYSQAYRRAYLQATRG